KSLWREQPPYRRELLQRPGAGAATGGGDRSPQIGCGALDQGCARRQPEILMPGMTRNVVVVDYGAGNLKSAVKARAAVGEAAAGEAATDIVATGDPERLRRADRVVLPGVGAFADCKRGLESQPGLIEALRESVIDRGRPFLGICVGMQLMATLGIEYGEHP